MRDLWSDYLDLNEHPDLAVCHFHIVRDILYARVSFQNFITLSGTKFIMEVKMVVQQLPKQLLSPMNPRSKLFKTMVTNLFLATF